tara:strand:- start:898 stop:1140 length:243 start_codon:yes stop_codon:yes gene_type:complete
MNDKERTEFIREALDGVLKGYVGLITDTRKALLHLEMLPDSELKTDAMQVISHLRFDCRQKFKFFHDQNLLTLADELSDE